MRSSRRFFERLLIASLAACGGPGHAGENPGTVAGTILQLPVGARAAAMGSAATAVPDGPASLHYNPAALASTLDREVSFMYLKGVEDQNIEHIAFASPLKIHGVFGEGYPTLGGSLLFAQHGSIEVNRTNPDGSLLDSRTLDAGGDLVATVGYAERIAHQSTDLLGESFYLHHFVGVSAKLIRSTLAEQYSATAFAADLGYYLRWPRRRWSAGFSILNLGSGMKYVSESDPLPMTMRLGLARDFFRASRSRITAALDTDYSYYERLVHVNAGVEYAASRLASLRVGYQFLRDVAGLTMGFGARLGDMRIDYAWSMQDALSDAHRLSLTYRFGRVPAKERANPTGTRGRRVVIEDRPRETAPRAASPVLPRGEPSEPARGRKPAPKAEDGIPGWIY